MPRERERPWVTVDVVVMAPASALPGAKEATENFSVLLIQRKNPPFEGKWAIPGGFVEPGETLVVMGGSIRALPVVVACFEFGFMGGSMGAVVGERFVRGVQTALEQKLPFVCFTSTGGARMQEGLLSLMQMAKTTAMITRLADAHLPFVSVLTDPTMGGVSASFAFLGDVVIAEPKALIGFAGPRVIEQTVREKLPEGFQRAEFLLAKGAIDMIVDRRALRDELAQLLALMLRQPAEALS